jgi:hypothetical protein
MRDSVIHSLNIAGALLLEVLLDGSSIKFITVFFAYSSLIFAQSSDDETKTIDLKTAKIIKNYPDDPKIIDFALGLKTSTIICDLTGLTPSVGATAHVQWNPKNSANSFRLKCAFDNWGNQHFSGTADDRAEVKRYMATAGFIITSKKGHDRDKDRSGGWAYFALESGVAHWHIMSTHPSFSNIRLNKYAAATLLGAEDRFGFLEFGFEWYFLGNDMEDRIFEAIGKGNSGKEIKIGGLGVGFVIGLGFKF